MVTVAALAVIFQGHGHNFCLTPVGSVMTLGSIMNNKVTPGDIVGI